MGHLAWKLGQQYARGVAVLTLPLDDESFRRLLRGQLSDPLPTARVNVPGRPADLIDLGSPGLFAVSPLLEPHIRDLEGVRLRPLVVSGMTLVGYSVVTVILQCGRVDYRSARELRRFGQTIWLQGLVVEDPDVSGDAAVPLNYEAILLTDEAASRIRAKRFSNLRLSRLSDVETTVSQDMLVAG